MGSKIEVVGIIALMLVIIISSIAVAQVELSTQQPIFQISVSPTTLTSEQSAKISINARYADGSAAAGKRLHLTVSTGTFSEANPITGNSGSVESTYYPSSTITSTVTTTIIVRDDSGNLVYSQAVTISGDDLSIDITPPPLDTTTESPIYQATTVANTCPVSQFVKIFPEDGIYTTSDIYAQVFGFNDAQGDAAGFQFDWMLNGALVHREQLNSPRSNLPDSVKVLKGDLLRVIVVPSDGLCTGTQISSETVVQNSLPVMTITHDSSQTNPKNSGQPVNFVVTVTDADGDSDIGDLMVDYGDGEHESFIRTPVMQTLTTATPTIGLCDDRLDNDQDGLIDYPYDPGCDSATDNTEQNPFPLPTCSDRLDNDGDFIIDFPFEPGCISASDNDETNTIPAGQCYDFIDNDQDTKFDFLYDPGCISAADTTEQDGSVLPECSDGVDNDQDGLIDRQDLHCFTASDPYESSTLSTCHNFIDDDSDGLRDFPLDPDCVSVFSSESGGSVIGPAITQCSNSIDDDGNSYTDYPNDPGCLSAQDTVEGPTSRLFECSDSLDNDLDGTKDYVSFNPTNPDVDCVSASDDNEGVSTAIFTTSFTFSHAYISHFNYTTYLVNASLSHSSITTTVTIVTPTITPVGCPEVLNLKATLNDDLGSVDLTWIPPLSGPIDAVKVCYIDSINSNTDLGSYSAQFEQGCNANGIVLSPSSTSFTDYTADQNSQRYYKIQSLCDGTVVPPTRSCTPNTLLGDLNGDGQVSIIDTLFGSQIAAGSLVFQGNNCCLDVNQDGTFMSILDVLLMSQISAGLIPSVGTCANPLPPAGQCRTNTDCNSQEQCAIPQGSTYGTCISVPRECSSTDILGDVDGDSDVDVIDSLKIAQYSVGSFNLQNNCCYNADGAGYVGNVLDSLAAAQIGTGLLRARGTCANPQTPVRLCTSTSQCLSGEMCNANGECSTGTIPPTTQCSVLGDVTGDGQVTSIDSLRLAQIAVGSIPSPGCCADANNDGIIGNVLDSQYASRVAVGSAPQLGTCSNPITPPSTIITCDAGRTVGDADGDSDVDLTDAEISAQLAVGLIPRPSQICCLDMDVNGNLNVIDSLAMAAVGEGIIPSPGVCGGTINPAFACSSTNPCDMGVCVYPGGSMTPSTPGSLGFCRSNMGTVSCSAGQKIGDANRDGVISILDAMVVSDISVGISQTSGNICCFDTDSDGSIGPFDVLKIAQHSVGLITLSGVCSTPLPGTGLSFFTGAQVASPPSTTTTTTSTGSTGTTTTGTTTPTSVTVPIITTATALDKRLTTNTVGKFEIPVYSTSEVYNEFSIPLKQDLTLEPFPKSLGLGRGIGNSNQLVSAGFLYCDKTDFAGSYDELRSLDSEKYSMLTSTGVASDLKIDASSLAYDPTVDCRVYSYDDLMTLSNIEPADAYHMKVTANDVLINVGEVIPLKQINTYNTGLNNWIGYTLLYTEIIEDALAEPLTAIGYFIGFDRIQTFNARLYLASRAAGKSVTQSFADANKDFVPGIPIANNTQLTHFTPGEGYRFNINRDDSFEFEHGKKR